MCGHESNEGGLVQLLQNEAEDNNVLKPWPSNRYTSSDIQNEILNVKANNIVRTTSNTIHGSTLQYSLIIDGVQDVSGIEQEAICLRSVDSFLMPHEGFIDFY